MYFYLFITLVNNALENVLLINSKSKATEDIEVVSNKQKIYNTYSGRKSNWIFKIHNNK